MNYNIICMALSHVIEIKRILRGDLKPYMGRNVKHMTLSFDTFELRMEDA
jgi:hypothetical protein